MLDLEIARYLTTRDPLPECRLTGYDYVLAGNGIWKRARNRHVEACLPLSRLRIAGLPDLRPSLRLLSGRVPGRLLWVALSDARERARLRPVEAMYHLYGEADKYRLVYPRQDSTAGHAAYQGGDDPAILLDLHSHCELGAFFSGTDNRDEAGFRFYGVMGQIFARPALSLRIGIYGDFWPVPVELLFTDSGPFEMPRWAVRPGHMRQRAARHQEAETWNSNGDTE